MEESELPRMQEYFFAGSKKPERIFISGKKPKGWKGMVGSDGNSGNSRYTWKLCGIRALHGALQGARD